MEQAVQRFARNILLVHLGLLAVVLALVFFASRAIHQSAREQALEQARSRQELLTDQTARGVEAFYESILSDLDLLPPAENMADEAALINNLTGFRGRPNRAQIAQRRTQFGPLLARQLEERVDYVFVYDKTRRSVYDVSTADAPADPGRPGPATGPEGRIVKAFAPWLNKVDGPAISPFEMVDGRGINLVCHPLPRLSAVVVAVVSVEKINEEFLKPLNKGSATRAAGRPGPDSAAGAFLVNDSLIAMAASRPRLVGADLGRVADAPARTALENLHVSDARGTRWQGWQVVEHPFNLGGESFEPAVLTAVPIQVPGKTWFVLVSSPLADVDSVVGTLFHRIAIWATFFVVAITGILVSTAIQLIRGRMKTERVRHDVLRRELERARQIQQAWLPRKAPACRRLDIAAVNYPAQHISGDFYNWFDLPDGRTAVAIGDVTGHGMSAAFLMATTQLLVRTTMERVNDPGQCLTEVNRQLCMQVFNSQFVTMQLLVIDPATRSVEIATAGHPAPLLGGEVASGPGPRPAASPTSPPPVPQSQVFQPLPIEPQLVLGVDADTAYETEHFKLPPGALLLLYTDGAADVQAPDGRRLGNDGLLQSLSPPAPAAASSRRHEPAALPAPAAGDARALLDRVVGAVDAFRGPKGLGDDLTLVALRLQSAARPAPRRPASVAAVP